MYPVYWWADDATEGTGQCSVRRLSLNLNQFLVNNWLNRIKLLRRVILLNANQQWWWWCRCDELGWADYASVTRWRLIMLSREGAPCHKLTCIALLSRYPVLIKNVNVLYQEDNCLRTCKGAYGSWRIRESSRQLFITICKLASMQTAIFFHLRSFTLLHQEIFLILIDTCKNCSALIRCYATSKIFCIIPMLLKMRSTYVFPACNSYSYSNTPLYLVTRIP